MVTKERCIHGLHLIFNGPLIWPKINVPPKLYILNVQFPKRGNITSTFSFHNLYFQTYSYQNHPFRCHFWYYNIVKFSVFLFIFATPKISNLSNK